MFKTLFLPFFVFAVSMANANDEIRSTIVQITGPKTKSILTKFVTNLSETESTIVIDRQTQIPDIIQVSAQFDKLSDRESLSLMRRLSLEAASCPDRSESKEIALNERANFLKRCYSLAISENLWSGINFGAWDQRAKRENKVALFSYGVSTTFKNLKPSQVTLIQKIVQKIATELDSSPDAIKSGIVMATFN